MKILKYSLTFLLLFIYTFSFANELNPKINDRKTIAYIASDISIPFWNIMANGIKNSAKEFNINVKIYDGKNSSKKELEATIQAIKDKVSGIIVSPSSSSACVTILKFAKNANIPVVIADVGTDSGEYISYISSNNRNGAYKLGQLLSQKMYELNWQKGKVGIIAIPQNRLNGQERTAGFIEALEKNNIKNIDIKQLNKWTEEETYSFVKEMIIKYPDLKAIWLQTSNPYKGAIKAINDLNKKDEILLVTFDAEPEFLELIPKNILIGSGMQQPYLMGEEALYSLNKHFKKEKLEKNLQIPILVISAKNIEKKLPLIKRNVLGIIKE